MSGGVRDSVKANIFAQRSADTVQENQNETSVNVTSNSTATDSVDHPPLWETSASYGPDIDDRTIPCLPILSSAAEFMASNYGTATGSESSSHAAAKWFQAKYRSDKGAVTESKMEQNRIGYDVYLSFRGEDTPAFFARLLHDALERNNFKTFFDDYLQREDEIASALLGAIEASEISIILFSENYVTTSWRLCELAHIVDCKKKNRDRRVLPVFYKVDPTDIRHQSGSFSLQRWIDGMDARVPVWKEALIEVANLSGYYYSDSSDR